MRFLLELFRWFISGSTEAESSTKDSPASSQPAVLTTSKSKPAFSDAIDFDLTKGANISQFLNDIRSIEPLSKQFSKAREELLDELKKLTPNRKN